MYGILLDYTFLFVVFSLSKKHITKTAASNAVSYFKTIPFYRGLTNRRWIHAFESFYYLLLMLDLLLRFFLVENAGFRAVLGGYRFVS
jgi:hypothetical protein